MAVKKLSELTALTAAADGDLMLINDISEPADADKGKKITAANLKSYVTADVIATMQELVSKAVNGRLTLESGAPVSSADQSGKTTLYYTPYKGNLIALYDGSKWNALVFEELSLSLAGLTANKNYDIWAYDNSGTVTLEALVWTNDSTRATALAYQDGVMVKSGAATRRYLGTIRINSSGGQCEDTAVIRGVWNLYNQEPRQLLTTGLSGNSDQTALGKSYYVVGNPHSNVATFGIGGLCNGSGSSYCALYLLFDTASIAAADALCGLWSRTSMEAHFTTSFAKQVAAGYHYAAMGLNVESSAASMSEGRIWGVIWG